MPRWVKKGIPHRPKPTVCMMYALPTQRPPARAVCWSSGPTEGLGTAVKLGSDLCSDLHLSPEAPRPASYSLGSWVQQIGTDFRYGKGHCDADM